MEVTIIAVQENFMDDKQNPGKKIRLNKLTFMLPEGVAELWTRDDYAIGDVVTLKIAPGPKYKPIVKIA